MIGINTYNNEYLVNKLYKLYLRKDKNDYREAIGKCLRIPIRD